MIFRTGNQYIQGILLNFLYFINTLRWNLFCSGWSIVQHSHLTFFLNLLSLGVRDTAPLAHNQQTSSLFDYFGNLIVGNTTFGNSVDAGRNWWGVWAGRGRKGCCCFEGYQCWEPMFSPPPHLLLLLPTYFILQAFLKELTNLCTAFLVDFSVLTVTVWQRKKSEPSLVTYVAEYF